MVCCLTGICMQHYIITPATLAPDFEILGHVWSVNDTIAWWFRLTSNSDRPHPFKTCTMCLRYWHSVSRAYRCTLIQFHQPSWPQILEFFGHLWSGNDAITSWLRLTSTSDCYPHPYKTQTKCLSHRYAVSQAYGCTLIPLHRPSCPQILDFFVTCGVETMPLHHGWGRYPPQTISHIHIKHIQHVWGIGMLSQRHMGAPLYHYRGRLAPDFWILGHLWSGNDAISL